MARMVFFNARPGSRAPLEEAIKKTRGRAPPGDEPMAVAYVSMHDSNAVKQFTVGFEFGAAELLAMLEPFQVTSIGVRHGLFTTSNPTGIIVTSGMKIGDKSSARERLDAWTEKTVNEIAARLKLLFQEQGWLN